MHRKTTISQRKETLKKLLHVLTLREDAVIQALHDDFGKSAFEAVLTETYFVTSELKTAIKKLRSWASDEIVFPSVLNFPSSDRIIKDPYGNVLVISPWNYPFQLAMLPVIAAYAAGNSVVLKPSELTPNTSEIVSNIISEVFDPIDVEVFQGGAQVAEKLLERRWDYIFFTGSVNVGKKVAQAAARYLTPVTLELGGKNPCIVTAQANLKLAAKRIVWGKFVNAGQTCIAPDYVLVEASVKSRLLQSLKQEIIAAYGERPQKSPDLPRIINKKHWERLVGLIEHHKVVHGGQSDVAELFIAPTIIDESDLASAIMKEEIFGPLLPVIGFSDENQMDNIIGSYEKPLSLYVFTDDRHQADAIIRKHAFGGGCVNDLLSYFANSRLPFGGVGNSGMGTYHGRFGFDTFTHKKPISRKANWLDITLRYAPYGNKVSLLRKWLKWL
ncbi:aldehyde dehydrogenase [Flavobacterium sp. MAH-1]|uniref:Aldehyde dehydrogenase n=1 Tax=Flavobacterium agri TaxID=2743471 RepID=A0A7Y8XZ42_9FLAO|nr:aldehyde dehydrogenase [Flavobacterium agri]NUY79584.1 aldehyde dehydrogenase [Flavobacterium agri]NYA69609.1 aldehyde dehydrogenase [Flavobacterium agri]